MEIDRWDVSDCMRLEDWVEGSQRRGLVWQMNDVAGGRVQRDRTTVMSESDLCIQSQNVQSIWSENIEKADWA